MNKFYLSLNKQQLELLKQLIKSEIDATTIGYYLKHPSYITDLYSIQDKIFLQISKVNNN